MQNNFNIEKYIFIDNIQDLYQIKASTLTSWEMRFSDKNQVNENSIYIIAEVDKNIKYMPFTKKDLKPIKKIYKLIRIYFNANYANFICNKNDNKDKIIIKINNSQLITNCVMAELCINQNSFINFVISKQKLFIENFDEVYNLELKPFNNSNENQKIKAKTYNTAINNNNYFTRIMVNNNNGININPNTNIYITNGFNTSYQNNNNFNNFMAENLKKNMELMNNQLILLQNMNLMQQQINNNFFLNNMPQNIGNNNSIQNNQNFQSNNNQIINSGNFMNYSAFVETEAKKYFSHVFDNDIEKKYFSKKGLNNVGLTCYMNSTLQCLLHIPELTSYFFKSYNKFENEYQQKIQKTESKGRISLEYNLIITNIFGSSKEKAYSPKYFNDAISHLNPQFSKYEANDAKDLIIYLLQQMHEELNYYIGEKLENIPKCNQLSELQAFNFFFQINAKLNFSIISYLFWGIVKQITICEKCKNKLYNFQYFQYLSFPLYNFKGQTFNLYKGLKEYISEEILCGDNQFYCQTCHSLQNARIFSKIYYTAPYLLINFDYGKNKVYNPDVFIFGEIICLTSEFLAINTSYEEYQLIAVSSHIGRSGSSGHYITFCKDTTTEDTWYKYNDSSVSKCSFEETKKHSPYLLLYKKKKTNSK